MPSTPQRRSRGVLVAYLPVHERPRAGNVSSENAHRTNRTRTRPHTPSADRSRSYATLAMDAGVDPKMLSDRMGHANTAITLQTYTHHSTGKDRDLARSVSEVIEKALDLAGSQ